MSDLGWPFVTGKNTYIERADGIYLYDASDRQIMDAAGGAIVVNVGHGRQRVAEAVARATLDYSYVVPPWLTPSRQAMLKGLQEHWLPEYLTRVHVTSGGTEANEAAMKMALQYQQAMGQRHRTRIIGRSISYHGTTLATASISGHPARKKGLEGALPGYLEVATPYPLRCPLGAYHKDAGAFYADQLRTLIEQQGPETIAAFLAEPITGSSGGAIVPPDDYWPRVREICDEYGIVLILDEVMTGFGRTGKKFGYQHWPIRPDILVSGKGLAGGYAPLGGVFATDRIGDAIQNAGFPVMFNTFGAHPAACAAAAEVLQIMVEEDHVNRVAGLGHYLQASLNNAFSNHPHVAEVRGRGLLAAIEIVRDRDDLTSYPVDHEITNKVVGAGLEAGVFYYGGGTGEVRDVICMGPPFIISESEIDTMVDTLSQALDRVLAVN